MMLGITGCSGSKKSETTVKSETNIETNQELDENTEKVDEKKRDTTGEDNVDKNSTNVYPGANSVVDIAMGTYDEGMQTSVCTVKMPENYIITSSYTDENGKNKTMTETNGRTVSEVIENGELKESSNVPSVVVLVAQGNVNNSFLISVLDAGEYSVQSEKEYEPDGVEVNITEGHSAYIYNTKGQYDTVCVYQISDRWTLAIQNKGQLKDQMSLEEFGKEMCELITPIE